MTTEWVVAAGAERLSLATSGTTEAPGPSVGELTFTVTNPGPVEDRVVFEIVPGDGAKRPWFTVDEPQRPVPGGQSATFLIKVSIPAGEPAGPFWVQGRVYSSDTAPEESSRVSGRVTGEIAPTTIKKSKPWWLLAVAALVVIVIGVVGWLILRPHEPVAELVAVPDLTGLTEAQARSTLADEGLVLGSVRRRYVPDGAKVIIHQTPAGRSAPIAPGSTVEVEIAVNLPPPELMTPGNNTTRLPGEDYPEFVWNPVPDATAYNVRLEYRNCRGFAGCDEYAVKRNANVTGTSWSPGTAPDLLPFGTIRWQVTPLDDFLNPGQSSGYFYYEITD